MRVKMCSNSASALCKIPQIPYIRRVVAMWVTCMQDFRKLVVQIKMLRQKFVAKQFLNKTEINYLNLQRNFYGFVILLLLQSRI